MYVWLSVGMLQECVVCCVCVAVCDVVCQRVCLLLVCDTEHMQGRVLAYHRGMLLHVCGTMYEVVCVWGGVCFPAPGV